jgi:hypothetical protein
VRRDAERPHAQVVRTVGAKWATNGSDAYHLSMRRLKSVTHAVLAHHISIRQLRGADPPRGPDGIRRVARVREHETAGLESMAAHGVIVRGVRERS